MPIVTGEFQVTSWKEDAYMDLEGDRKLTHASVTQDLSGGVAGRGRVEWLMSYQQNGSARFVGLQYIEGSLDGREGSLVVETVGDFDGGVAQGSWAVIPDSGTGELAGVRGDGQFRAPMGGTPSFSLDYRLE